MFFSAGFSLGWLTQGVGNSNGIGERGFLGPVACLLFCFPHFAVGIKPPPPPNLGADVELAPPWSFEDTCILPAAVQLTPEKAREAVPEHVGGRGSDHARDGLVDWQWKWISFFCYFFLGAKKIFD